MKTISIFTVFLIFAAAVCGEIGERGSFEYQQPRGRDTSSERAKRLEEQRQQAKQVFSKTKADLDFLLEAVNANREIETSRLEEIKRDFIAVRREFRNLDNQQQSDMMLIDAWLAYIIDGDIEGAIKRSERSCLLHPLNGDAYKSSVVFSLLSARPPKPQSAVLRLIRTRPDEPEPVMDNSVLNVEVPEFARALIGKQVPAPAAGANAEGEAYSCILVWTINPQTVADEDLEKLKSVVAGLSPEKRAMVEGLAQSQKVDTEYVKRQLEAFALLFDNNTADEVDFLSVNVDEADVLAEFAATMKLSPQPLPAGAMQLFSGDVGKASKMVGAMMLIVDKQGSVRYAGAAEGFLPIMLLNELIEGSQKQRQLDAKPAKTAPPAWDMGTGEIDALSPPQPPARDLKITDANSLPTDATNGNDELTDSQREENTAKLSPEQRKEAENLLASAGMFRGSHTRLGSSRRVVDSCFEVIEKYPGTTYELQARQILDTIPAHQKKRHGID